MRRAIVTQWRPSGALEEIFRFSNPRTGVPGYTMPSLRDSEPAGLKPREKNIGWAAGPRHQWRG
jgi:hypothetical protein